MSQGEAVKPNESEMKQKIIERGCDYKDVIRYAAKLAGKPKKHNLRRMESVNSPRVSRKNRLSEFKKLRAPRSSMSESREKLMPIQESAQED